MSDFNLLFLDTEGSEELSEIAILDYSGTLVYEAFNQNHPKNSPNRQLSDRLNFELIYKTIIDIKKPRPRY